MKRPIIIGIPGNRLAQLRRKELRSTLFHGLLTVILTATASVVFIQISGIFGLIAALAGIVGAVIEGWRATQSQNKLARLDAGWRAERKVGKLLHKTPLDVVAHGVLIGKTGDSDHVILGPCAAVIETKHGHGLVEISNGLLAVRGRRMPRDPLAQASRQAEQIERRLKVSTTPILCVVEMSNRPFVFNGVIVCSAADLKSVIATLPNVISSDNATKLSNLLR
jgi:hypothetical protein